jgi:hypothetical protein
MEEFRKRKARFQQIEEPSWIRFFGVRHSAAGRAGG